ncbi:hypothetical protein DXT96_21095 [Agrobacterium sp. ICMP 6402]|uniref:hypothetical protein n=1 Tax=Agrobacterium sp. ICMP 6402 TaxID=2292443 RepID=UPI0012980B4E|nr:hypothetical protein [Agrobacterium sp. ICMP 6402]MQB12344.1 hypothetical protein [Agrobacterium sp. ICMP 6402]
MLDWFLNFFVYGTMKASDFQSVAQLTVAISLAFVVAGPDVSRLLRSSVLKFKHLDTTLKAITASGAQVPNTSERQGLLSSAAKFINSDAARTAPANASTTWFYAISAVISFIMLVYCTFGADLYRAIGVIATAGALVVITRDAFLAARRASALQVLANEVHRITRTFDISISSALSLSQLKKAASVIARLELQNIELREAIKELKAI